ncbi:CRISPR-associated endonuclease Cas2 [Thermosediminibacter oceani]|uniref:CRISPR-associated endoribonuclease Cas2 n=1 Tax=Thermosediminibacter oceani (strain ATCC BAA-1034 / DSM 16646 / JW/IW-1228P) TaxID=555079 RepID=D9RZH0_THEOJ|nr:CRISPR-associated endonuclease Cas2 [Thermosediminibacter oceani]ADL06868.1 CRISPR-associated protein, Cas2 family [Thermosediminibacter oceani DSM 16646]
MFIILVYDVGEKRVAKVLKICRKYLTWVQNSVFEGEITESAYKKLKLELKRAIVEDEDSVIFYILRTIKYSDREMLGRKKGGEEIFL